MNATSGPSGANSEELKKGISDADHIMNGTKWVCILTGVFVVSVNLVLGCNWTYVFHYGMRIVTSQLKAISLEE